MRRVREFAAAHPKPLYWLFSVLEDALRRARPLLRGVGYPRLERPFASVERSLKGLLFDCGMCGQCLLASTGMSCPMNCPKQLRNGPCGGIGADHSCEVDRSMRCVWADAYREDELASALAPVPNPPVERDQVGTSAWLRLAREEAPLREAPRPVPRATDSRLEALLRSGQLAVTAELCPPDSADPAEVQRRVERFGGLVDAINVTDGTGANCHMSSLGMAALLIREGHEPVMQMGCRDRNRIAVQGDILGAAALGVRNLVCITGDDVSNGDHPGAARVFDLDSMSLLDTARRMRDEGKFRSGRKLTSSPELFIGAVENPFMPPYELRALRIARKVAAGAQFIQTQYCFDVPLLERFLARYREEKLSDRCFLLVGVGLIPSARTACWIRSHVPGVHIPDAIVTRLERAHDARAEGVRICIELIQRIAALEGVAGVHIMAHKHEDRVPEIVAGSGILAGRSESRAAITQGR